MREARAAGLTPDDTAQAFARVLKDRGLLGSADKVITTTRAVRIERLTGR